MGRFDLNIESMLSDWTVVSALRELIANALDEQKLSETQEISITERDHGEWWIVDYGRGLAAEHLTLNENEEKTESLKSIIGKFGVGLKDSLATLYRDGINVEIHSTNGVFRLIETKKNDFEDIITLHVDYDSQECIEIGTEVRLKDVSTSDIREAMNLFLELSGHVIIESNEEGQVINPGEDTPGVYIHGVRVNDEPTFLFSYNITSLNPQLSRFLNRERQAVSRSVYGVVLKELLINCTSELIRDSLAAEIEERETREVCYEVRRWADIGVFALERLSEQKSVVAVTQHQLEFDRHHIDDMRSEGTLPILIKKQELTQIKKLKLTLSTNIRLLEDWIAEDQEKYSVDPVDESEMSESERGVYKIWAQVMRLVGVQEYDEPELIISNTTRPPRDAGEVGGRRASVGSMVVGYYDRASDVIVIHRSQLNSTVDFVGTLLHELAHRSSGLPDINRGFEIELTRFLGLVGAIAIDG